MTTQIDDQFTNLLLAAFDLPALVAMSPIQRRVMRDMFVSGIVVGLDLLISDPDGELQQYRLEQGTEIAETKARHCVQEAIILKRAGN